MLLEDLPSIFLLKCQGYESSGFETATSLCRKLIGEGRDIEDIHENGRDDQRCNEQTVNLSALYNYIMGENILR